MTVAAILKGKGGEVVSLPPGASLAEAARLLGARRIGAVVIREADGRLAGILSERDVVRALAARGAEGFADTVSAWMTREIRTASPATTPLVALGMMTSGRFRHLPVLREGELVGLVSIGDLVKARLEQLESEVDGLRAYVSGGA